MTNVTCMLTVEKPGSAACPVLVIEYGTTLLYFTADYIRSTEVIRGTFLNCWMVIFPDLTPVEEQGAGNYCRIVWHVGSLYPREWFHFEHSKRHSLVITAQIYHSSQ